MKMKGAVLMGQVILCASVSMVGMETHALKVSQVVALFSSGSVFFVNVTLNQLLSVGFSIIWGFAIC